MSVQAKVYFLGADAILSLFLDSSDFLRLMMMNDDWSILNDLK